MGADNAVKVGVPSDASILAGSKKAGSPRMRAQLEPTHALEGVVPELSPHFLGLSRTTYPQTYSLQLVLTMA